MLKSSIFVPIFNSEIKLIVSSMDQISSYIENIHNLKGWDVGLTSARGLCITVDGQIYIWIDQEEKDTDDIQSIVGHEVIHAVYAIINNRGISLECQETFCYLWQFIWEEIWKLLHGQMEATSLPSMQEDTQQ